MSTGTSPPATSRNFSDGLWACRRLYDTAKLQWAATSISYRRYRVWPPSKVHWHLSFFLFFSRSKETVRSVCISFIPPQKDDVAKLALASPIFPPVSLFGSKNILASARNNVCGCDCELTVCARAAAAAAADVLSTQTFSKRQQE